MAFESAEQFDRAAKRSIRELGRDPGTAYREMLRDRFLCRMFGGADDRFVLKAVQNPMVLVDRLDKIVV